MSMEVGERVARVEQRVDIHDQEIDRLRDGHTSLERSLTVISNQLGSLAGELHSFTSNVDLIAERAAHKILNAYLATLASDKAIETRDKEANLANNLTKALLAALGVAGAALGLKFSGVI